MEEHEERIRRVAEWLGIRLRKPSCQCRTKAPYILSPPATTVVLAEANDLEEVLKALYVLGRDEISDFIQCFWTEDGEGEIQGLSFSGDRFEFAMDLARLWSAYLVRQGDEPTPRSDRIVDHGLFAPECALMMSEISYILEMGEAEEPPEGCPGTRTVH